MKDGTPPRRRPANDSDALLQDCRNQSVALLKRNLTPAGILAATANAQSEERGYTAIFGRDAAICAVGMVLSGDEDLRRGAVSAMITLAEHQAANGQIPKFVDVRKQEPDFWYLGCIDSTLWWLIALDYLDAHESPGGLRKRYAKQIDRAIDWLLAQEHQRFRLLQQNEASDWADIMPRSGFVLYTNALWYHVKKLFDVPHAKETCDNFNGLFHPFSAGIAEYRRAHLLADYAMRGARNRDVYLSFVNFSFFGEEGDVFGNVLAMLLGLADEKASRRTLRALIKGSVHYPYPVRVVQRPIRRENSLWRPYMSRHKQNFVWQYHNGGIWPMVGGFWVAALVACGRMKEARAELIKLARACKLQDWRFTEWLHGRTLAARGMAGQSWNAAAFLFAHHSVDSGSHPFSRRA
jgi:Alkaline and neutral invertase